MGTAIPIPSVPFVGNARRSVIDNESGTLGRPGSSPSWDPGELKSAKAGSSSNLL